VLTAPRRPRADSPLPAAAARSRQACCNEMSRGNLYDVEKAGLQGACRMPETSLSCYVADITTLACNKTSIDVITGGWQVAVAGCAGGVMQEMLQIGLRYCACHDAAGNCLCAAATDGRALL
jgi:hypothetical protein